MTISPWGRLSLLVLAGIIPRWQLFFSTSSDYSLRGLAMPIVDSIGVACVIIIARTRNPLVDGVEPEAEPVKIVNTSADPVKTLEQPKIVQPEPPPITKP